MKKIFALCIAFSMAVTASNAAFVESKTGSNTEKKESYGAFKNAAVKAAAEEFVRMSRQDYEQVTGKHLSLVERAAFKIQQKRMKKELQRAAGDGTSSVIGFVAGLFLSLLGVLLVYVLSDDPNMRKWAWIGAVISLIVYGVIFI